MKLFLDSSALVKRYVEEAGSDNVIERCAHADETAVCIVCVPEVISACNRLVREKKITRDQYDWIKNEFILDMGEFAVVDLTTEVIARSVECLEKGSLRSLDALHVAAAVEYGCDLFLTRDVRQKGIAIALGLNIETV